LASPAPSAAAFSFRPLSAEELGFVDTMTPTMRVDLPDVLLEQVRVI
jgi:hypothetical protein